MAVDFSLLCKAVLDATTQLDAAKATEATTSAAWGAAMSAVQSCVVNKQAAEQALINALSGDGLLGVVPTPPAPTPTPAVTPSTLPPVP